MATTPDLRESIRAALLADPGQSNRAIAATLGCSKTTVSQVRAALGEQDHPGQPGVREDGPPVTAQPAPPPADAQRDTVTAAAPASTEPQPASADTDLWRCDFCSWRQFQPGMQHCEACGWPRGMRSGPDSTPLTGGTSNAA